MKLRRLWIKNYKNLQNCTIDFSHPSLIQAMIGSNGSGKSNVIEAILHILIGTFFRKVPKFDFEVEFEAQNRHLEMKGDGGTVKVQVDGEHQSLTHFVNRLHDGASQVYYPELTFVYYSGECQRVRQLIRRYQRYFQRITLKTETHRLRPLFVESTNKQAQVILLGLFAHKHRAFLDYLQIEEIASISVVLRSPEDFDPSRHEPKLWNTEGAIREIVAAIDEFAQSSVNHEPERTISSSINIPINLAMSTDLMEHTERSIETRTYVFADEIDLKKGIYGLAGRMARYGENIYSAFEQLRARGILVSINFKLKRRNATELFAYDQLSEGEKQLIAVIGAIRLMNQKDNLVLLDEPDTHLNPKWSWDYLSMLEEAFAGSMSKSTVLMATHDPVMISGMVREQVLVSKIDESGRPTFERPIRNPRGQGVANLLCSSEFFGLPSSLDKQTQKLLDERLDIIVKETLTAEDKKRLEILNQQLEILPGISERDPNYVAFLRAKSASGLP